MTTHDAWASSAETDGASRDLRMDEATAHQLVDELITLASSMFGLLQPHPGSNLATAAFAADAGPASPKTPSIQDPASVVSVAIPVEPVVAVNVPESWTQHEPDAEATEDDPAVPPAALNVPALDVPALVVPSLAVPSLAVPELAEIADLPSASPVLSLVERLEVPELDGLDKLDQRESELDQRGPDAREPEARPSLALLSEIAFLDE